MKKRSASRHLPNPVVSLDRKLLRCVSVNMLAVALKMSGDFMAFPSFRAEQALIVTSKKVLSKLVRLLSGRILQKRFIKVVFFFTEGKVRYVEHFKAEAEDFSAFARS